MIYQLLFCLTTKSLFRLSKILRFYLHLLKQHLRPKLQVLTRNSKFLCQLLHFHNSEIVVELLLFFLPTNLCFCLLRYRIRLSNESHGNDIHLLRVVRILDTHYPPKLYLQMVQLQVLVCLMNQKSNLKFFVVIQH